MNYHNTHLDRLVTKVRNAYQMGGTKNRSGYSISDYARKDILKQENPIAAISAAAAVAGVVWQVSQNKGDITLERQRMTKYWYPWRDNSYHHKGNFKPGYTYVKSQLLLGPFDLELSATIGVKFMYNGHVVGPITCFLSKVSDQPAWGINITTEILPVSNTYSTSKREGIARVDVDFNFEFNSGIFDQRFKRREIQIYGNGYVKK